ncbi:MAG: hypothetical protein ABSG80_06960 [Verrucomicrobiota bacterium]|jgi:hypothetical protein
MNSAAAESPPAGPAGTTQVAVEAPTGWKPPGTDRWTNSRWLTLIALVFAAHVALLFVFGGRKQIVPRTVTNVPTLKLADNSSELLALNDPTLFVLPHQKDFASVIWLQTAALKQPSFRWTEPPRWLPLSADELGLAFNQFMQTNHFASFELQLKPPLKLSAPGLPVETALAQNSTLRVEGELAQRQLPSPINLTNWPYANVIAPSKVQVLVDTTGNVVSTVLLPPDSGFIAADQYDKADERALELARAMRFTPSSHLTIGRMIFNWHTVPPPATNAPAASP